VLVIGVGNELRADDGVGRAVAEALAADPRLAGVDARSVRQLTPELALDVASAGLVVFVDADTLLAAGRVEVGPVDGAVAGAFSHHLTPAALVGLARILEGAVVNAIAVRIGIRSVELGGPRTAAAERGIARAVERIGVLVEGHRAAGPAGA
jgi:hydrogenase maturation protease